MLNLLSLNLLSVFLSLSCNYLRLHHGFTDIATPMAKECYDGLDTEMWSFFPTYLPPWSFITGAQPKAGTGLKMQTVSVFFSTLHC